MSKNVGDLNLKLKMEIGALKSENEGLVRKNEEIRAQVTDIETKIQVSHCGFRCGAYLLHVSDLFLHYLGLWWEFIKETRK